MTTYAVTGATGGLGGATVLALIDRGIAPGDIVAVVRNATKAQTLADAGVLVRIADYADPEALRAALTGVDRLVLVSGSELGHRVSQHGNVIDAAKQSGLQLIAYTSLLGADTSPLSLAGEHVETEKLLAASGIAYVLLRNGWYWENYAASAPTAIDGGVFYGSAGNGAVAGASRLDYASAAAAAVETASGGEVFELAGTDHLTYADLADAMATVSGRPVRYQNLSESDYAQALEGAGLPTPIAAMLANSDSGAAAGALDSDATDLRDLIGRDSIPFSDVLRAALAPTPTA